MKWRRVVCLGAVLALSGCNADWGSDLSGHTVSATQPEGRWTVINYWAEWCAPCRSEIPELNALAEADGGPRVLGVNFDGLQGDALRSAATTLGIEFPVLLEDPAERLALPRAAVLPVTYLIDADGKVREQRVGEQTAVGLLERIATLRDGQDG